MREPNDFQRLAWMLQDMEDERREKERQNRQCAVDTQNAVGITLELADISEMLKLVEKISRGLMSREEMVMEAAKFMYKHKPVPTLPRLTYKYEAEED